MSASDVSPDGSSAETPFTGVSRGGTPAGSAPSVDSPSADSPAVASPSVDSPSADSPFVDNPAVDIVDEIFLTVPRRSLARRFADPAFCRDCWPDLDLRVQADRGDEGMRWFLTGSMTGTMEVWLETVLDGTVLHYYLRADPVAGMDAAGRANWIAEQTRRRRLAARTLAFELKNSFERDRAPGCPPDPVQQR